MSCSRQFFAFIFVSEEAVTGLARGHTEQFQRASWMPDLLGLAPRASPTPQERGVAGQKRGRMASGKVKRPKPTIQTRLDAGATSVPPRTPASYCGHTSPLWEF